MQIHAESFQGSQGQIAIFQEDEGITRGQADAFLQRTGKDYSKIVSGFTALILSLSVIEDTTADYTSTISTRERSTFR